MTLTKKVALNTGYQIIGKLVATITSLALVIFLTRYLGTYGYGEYTTIFSYVGFFNVFVDLGLYMIAVREISKKGVDAEKIVGNLFIIRLVLAFVVFATASTIAFFMPYSNNVKIGIILGSVAIGMITLSQTFVSVLQAKLKMHLFSIAEIVGRVTVFLITLFMIYQKYGLLEIVSAYIIGDGIHLGLLYFFSKKYVKFRPRFDWSVSKKLLTDAIPLGIVHILGMIHFKMDTILLSAMPLKVAISNMDAVGIYGVAYKMVEVLDSFPKMFIGSIFPVLTAYLFAKDQRANKVFQKSLDFIILLAVPLIVGGAILSPFIIEVISSKSFLDASGVLQILVFAVALTFVANLFTYTIVALNKQSKLIWIMLTASAFNLTANLILIPHFTYYAAAITTVITHFIIFILSWWIVKKDTMLNFKLKMFYKALLASLVMGLFLFVAEKQIVLFWTDHKVIQLLTILITMLVAVFIYFFSAYLFRAFSKEDLVKIFKRS